MNTLRFGNVSPAGGAFSVNVSAIGPDANLANNSASVWVNGAPQYYGNYGAPVPQPATYPTSNNYYDAYPYQVGTTYTPSYGQY